MDRGRVGWLLAGGRTPLEGHGIKICSSQKKVSQSMPQDFVLSYFDHVHFIVGSSFTQCEKSGDVQHGGEAPQGS